MPCSFAFWKWRGLARFTGSALSARFGFPPPPRSVDRAGRDRKAPIATERHSRDLGPDRALAALPFGAIDEPGHELDHARVETERDDVRPPEATGDVGVDDVVEQLVGRQRVLIGLVGAQLGAR